MILDVGRIRVTFVAIRTLYTTYTAQMTYVIIEIFPPFEPLPASIAVQIVAVEIRIRIFHATNLVFLFARVPHVERQISLLGERLAALRTLYSVRPCTGRRVFPFESISGHRSKHFVYTDWQFRMPSSDVPVNVRG